MGGLFTWKYEGKDSGQDFICVEILMQGSIWKKKVVLREVCFVVKGLFLWKHQGTFFF